MSDDHTSTRDEIFGPLIAGRNCGDCSACCTYLRVESEEFQKPAGVTCQHCTAGGCDIYATRFPVCRVWHCLWKHIPSLPEEARPDRSGVLCCLERQADPETVFSRLNIRLMVIDRGKAESSELLGPMLEMFKQGDLPVWLDTLETQLRLVHPDVVTASAVLNSSDEGMAEVWRSGVRLAKKDGA